MGRKSNNKSNEKPNLRTPTSRDRLPVRTQPYFEVLEDRLHLGVRRNAKGPDAWVAQRLLDPVKRDDGTWYQPKKQHRLGAVTEAFERDQAAEAARAWFRREQHGVDDDLTVWQGIEKYGKDLKVTKKDNPRAVEAIMGRLKYTVKDQPIASIPINSLHREDLLDWRRRLVEGEELENETVNRALSIFTVALNYVRKNVKGVTVSEKVWEDLRLPVSREKKKRSDRRWSDEDKRRFFKVAPPEVAAVAKAILFTGHRPGTTHILDVRVEGFKKPDPKRGLCGQFTSHTRKGKGYKRSYTCDLTPEASEFFMELSKDKLPKAYLFTKKNGERWDTRRYCEAFDKVLKAAGLPLTYKPYDLRHTTISELLERGVSTARVADQTGTEIKEIQHHYYHGDPGAELHKLEGYKALGE